MQTSMMPFSFCTPFHSPLRTPPTSPASTAGHPYADFSFQSQNLNRTILSSTQHQSYGRKSTGVSSFTIEAILGLQHQHQETENSCSTVSVFGAPVPITCWPSSDGPNCRRAPGSPGSVSPDSTRKDRSLASSPGQPVRTDDSNRCIKVSAPSSRSLCSPSTLQAGSGNSKAKRVRTIFTPEQLERLEREFERQQYMVGPERLYLASSLHLSEAQVKVWFQNRRIKWRKQHLEVQQARLARLKQNGGSPPNMDELSASSADDVMQFASSD